jgi:hypothetical protein
MATKITVALEDDLDGGPASETVRFVEHARKAGPGQRRGPARTASSRQRSVDIRAWTKAMGLPVSDRGRLPATVVDQYEAAAIERNVQSQTLPG